MSKGIDPLIPIMLSSLAGDPFFNESKETKTLVFLKERHTDLMKVISINGYFHLKIAFIVDKS